MRVELFIWSTIINAIFSFAMVALVLFSRPMSKVKALWACLCVTVGIWSVALATMSATDNYATALLGSKIVTGFSIFIPVLLFHTVHALLNKREAITIITLYASGLILSTLNFFGFLMDVRPIMDFAYYTSAKPAYSLFMVQLYGGFALILFTLWKAARSASPLLRNQLMSLFWASGFGFLGGQTTVPAVYDLNIFPYGVFIVPAYVLFVGYGMLRYQFMDFKLALRKLGLSVGIYACLVLLTLPFLWPQIRAIANYSSNIAIHLWTTIVTLAFILAAGPAIYAFITHKAFWLYGHSTVGLVHELRSPLSNISGAMDLLKRELLRLPYTESNVPTYTKILEENVVRLESNIDDLLQMVALQEGRIEIAKVSFQLDETIQTVLNHYQSSAERKNLKFLTAYTASPTIFGDPQKIQQIFSNLISNAIKFSVNGTICVETREEGKTFLCTVTDAGAGIRQQDLNRVFDRFYQGKNSSKGSGIGLTIAKAWVEAHGGKIWAESEGEGKGATIHFTLPTA